MGTVAATIKNQIRVHPLRKTYIYGPLLRPRNPSGNTPHTPLPPPFNYMSPVCIPTYAVAVSIALLTSPTFRLFMWNPVDQANCGSNSLWQRQRVRIYFRCAESACANVLAVANAIMGNAHTERP